MTQTRPRIDDERLIAKVQAYADSYGISFNAAVRILLWKAVKQEEAS
jgi:antitoxin component of RelBE/YafQ-DinJ toxin-antitoxin module